MKRHIAILLFLIYTTVCHAAWRENEKRIDTTLQVSQFNRIASKYLEVPTSVIALKMGGVESLGVEARKGNEVYFSINHVDEYLAMIAKYMEWQKQASENGDAFTKTIGEVKGPMAGIRERFGFYSGNAKTHYLTIGSCVTLFNTCSDVEEPPQFYDLDNAKKLVELLNRFKSGELKSEDVSEKYK